MDSDVKIKRALIDTPGLREYMHGTYRYTPELLEKMSKDFRNQIVELDVHDGMPIGNFVKMGYCPTHGLWADMAVPVDTPEDDIEFSSDVQVLKTEMDEDGVKTILDATLNKAVWITPNGQSARNKETRLCNTDDLEDKKMAEEDQKQIGELNVKLGQLETKLAQKDQALSALESEKGTLEGELTTLKETNTEYESELKMRRKREDNYKEKLLTEIVGDNDVLKEAYKKWSIKELKALKKEKGETVEDTPPKGAKSKAVKKPGKKEKADDKPTYADLQKARDAGVI